MRAAVELRDLDFASAPEAVLRAAHRVHAPSLLSVLPDDEPMPFEEWHSWFARLSASLDLRHVVADAGDQLVAFGFVELSRDHNLHLAWTDLAVAEAYRRHGLGRRALARLVEIAAQDGRTSLGWGAAEGSPGQSFAEAVGLTHRQGEHLNRLSVADVDQAMLRSWVERAAERAGGYRLEAWDGPTPAELVERFAVCAEVMNTVPLDDLDVEDERMTPERLVRLEKARAGVGMTWWTLVAVEEATGHFAGFTQLFLSPWRHSIAHQGDTGVDPAHRDRGLGRWLKAAMLLRLAAEHPEVVSIDTHNAASNEPMLAINHALGFRPARRIGHWQGDLATVRERL